MRRKSEPLRDAVTMIFDFVLYARFCLCVCIFFKFVLQVVLR